MFSFNKGESEPINCADPNDFRRLYDSAMEILFKVSLRIVGDEEAAEDLVHDSFIKANEKGMVFPSQNDALFWLIRVVKNASLNYAKRKTREAKAYHKAFYAGKQDTESGEIEFLKKEAKKTVVDALSQLPEDYRAVMTLKEYSDMNYKEIGRLLGITENNVKQRVLRARSKLLKIIGEDDVYLS